MITQPPHTFCVLDEVPRHGTELKSAFSRLCWLHTYSLYKKKPNVKQFALFYYEWQSHFHKVCCNLYHLQKTAILPQRWLVMREEKAFGWEIYNFFSLYLDIIIHFHKDNLSKLTLKQKSNSCSTEINFYAAWKGCL